MQNVCLIHGLLKHLGILQQNITYSKKKKRKEWKSKENNQINY